MSTRNPVGTRGVILLAATAIAGVALAVHGWGTHERSALPGPLAGSGSSSPAASPPATTHHATAGPPVPSSSAGPSAGPLLSTQSFAQYSFRIWPGVPSAQAKAAMTGLTISVHKRGTGLLVAAGVTGQAVPAPKFYPGGARVYVIEATLGDDSNSSDYNLGDDGLVVTDARGRILQ